MSALQLERLSKTYPNGVAAVCDLDLAIAAGERLTLVGPSGCGKTTILRLIAGLEQPTSGSIRRDGIDITRGHPRKRDVAFVFQRHNLYPHLNVRRNLSFGMDLRRRHSWLHRLLAVLAPAARQRLRGEKSEIADRVVEAARLLDLSYVLERRPDQLSGGQQQRVALGRALVQRPSVWLLDEPLSHLDPHLRAELRRHLHLLHRRLKVTMIYVTHDQLEAMTLGERLVVMDQGRVQQAGPPEEVYDRPRNRFVAGFVGWPPMNFLVGRLLEEDGQAWFAGSGGRLPVPQAWLSYAVRPGCDELILGVRPEHVRMCQGQGAGLRMEVALVENIGAELLVSCRRDDWLLTVRCQPPAPRMVGQVVDVEVSMKNAHWFDAATGLAVARKDPKG